MAVTTPTHVDTSIPEVWAKMVLRDTLRAGFWKNMIGGEGSGLPIIQKTELLNNPGDTIHIQVTAPLAGAGVSGDTTQLVGSEENLTTSEKLVVPTLYRHAVRVNRRANKKSIIDLRSEAKLRLAEWGEEKMDDLRFATFTQTSNLNGASYTPNILVVGGGSDESDVDDVDFLTVEAIMQTKLALQNQKAKPIRIAGAGLYAMVVHPNALYRLKREDEYQSWVREAERRGPDNPFFQGATAMIDGVVLFESYNVPVFTAGGADSNDVAKNIAFGAEAFIEGVDENVSWNEDDFDYGLEFGIAYSFAMQARRALELSSVQVYTDAESPLA
jgi:N4-gp56 family major capsid protein